MAPDFWQSKTSWTGFIGIVSLVLTMVFRRPDLVQPITGAIIALSAIFIRDQIHVAAAKVAAATVTAADVQAAAGPSVIVAGGGASA